ncbi:MAG: ferredoxin family protein [Lachnospiraceae bacterium]|nr:ferredoxin family protein [Lachnospiraceae bacterium]
MKKLSIDDKLGLDMFHTDELNSHIQVNKECKDQEEIRKLLLACPAECYKVDEAGNLQFSHLGCLECGTCRVLSLGKVVEDWNYPMGTKGVFYRQG